MDFETLSDNPKLIDELNSIHSEPWPAFLREDIWVKKYWRKLYDVYPQYQFLFKEGSEYFGLANCSPIEWNGKEKSLPEGFGQALERVIINDKNANCLCVMAIVVRKKYAGRGSSSGILEIVKEYGTRHGFRKLIIPVRPTLKSKYPLIPMVDYMKWQKSGHPFDPWIKIHIKNGGRILKEAMPSMMVEGTISQWEDWTGMYFGSSGDYVIDGALNPVSIDLENNIGRYIEPNVWILHEF
jgi:hypothetical protein